MYEKNISLKKFHSLVESGIFLFFFFVFIFIRIMPKHKKSEKSKNQEKYNKYKERHKKLYLQNKFSLLLSCEFVFVEKGSSNLFHRKFF